mmetsp:Transcript_16222/g.33341  ORF Transcript_16222/g.33341 Transcript_16222/m.33341 type:complete len:124 (+) Transcript_16222:1008-1379(+)
MNRDRDPSGGAIAIIQRELFGIIDKIDEVSLASSIFSPNFTLPSRGLIHNTGDSMQPNFHTPTKILLRQVTTNRNATVSMAARPEKMVRSIRRPLDPPAFVVATKRINRYTASTTIPPHRSNR